MTANLAVVASLVWFLWLQVAQNASQTSPGEYVNVGWPIFIGFLVTLISALCVGMAAFQFRRSRTPLVILDSLLALLCALLLPLLVSAAYSDSTSFGPSVWAVVLVVGSVAAVLASRQERRIADRIKRRA